MKDIKKVATFRASSIGDALNAKYLLEHIHAAYPAARCGIIVAGKAPMIRDLLAAYPWIEIVEASRRKPFSFVTLCRRFGASDLVVIPPAKAGTSFSLPSKLAARLLARRGGLIGFRDASGINGFLYDQVIPLLGSRAPRLFEEAALQAAGIPLVEGIQGFEFIPQPGLLDRLQLDPKGYVVVHLFAGSEGRGPSPQKRQELLNALARVLPQRTLLLTGSTHERESLKALSLPPHARIVAGELSVQELAAVMASSACVVSVGSGPSHIAASLGVPVLVLVTCHGMPWVGEEQYGAGLPLRIFSAVSACANGHDHASKYPVCIEKIDAMEVARAAADFS